MECPHCKQDLPALTCDTCGQLALPGASFCHTCGKELPAPAGEEPKLLTCESCGHKALPGANFCHSCGKELPGAEPPAQIECASCGHQAHAEDQYCSQCGGDLAPEAAEEVAEGEAPAPGKRVACSDGSCIGIIGPDGKCTECGKPYTGPAE